MSSFSAQLRERVEPTWRAAVHHRFVDELLAGTLDDAVLRHYIVQDYAFVDPFLALIGQALASAPDLQPRLVFGRQLGMLCTDEDGYFVQTLDSLDVPAADRTAPTLHPATTTFNEVMADALASRSYPAVLAVIVVAEWLYLEWGSRADAGLAATRPEHVGWVDLHRGTDFTAWVGFLRGQLDAAEPTDPDERALVEELFDRAVACELAFFDAAYDLP